MVRYHVAGEEIKAKQRRREVEENGAEHETSSDDYDRPDGGDDRGDGDVWYESAAAIFWRAGSARVTDMERHEDFLKTNLI